MDLDSKTPEERPVSVMVKMTTEMESQLKAIAEKIGGGVGVATVVRMICANALAEGINVKRRKAAADGEARA